MSKQAIVIEAHQGGRLDALLREHFPDTPRRLLQDMIADGAVQVDSVVARKKGARVRPNATITVTQAPPTAEDLRVSPQPDPCLHVIHESAHLLVLNKPAQQPSHPLRHKELDTLANHLVATYPECAAIGADPREAGLVHRLDTGTTGAIAAARDAATWTSARAAFAEGAVRKDYLALVAIAVNHPGECEEPLLQAGRRAKVSYEPGALPAHTSWTVEARSGSYSLLRCRAHTGRMHQIRAHLAYTGAPIVGDELYGGPPAPEQLTGHFLHAARLSLLGVDVQAPLPAERSHLLRKLGLNK